MKAIWLIGNRVNPSGTTRSGGRLGILKIRFWMLVGWVLALASGQAAPGLLEQGFRRVPDSDKPWVYWWWLNGNVDEPTITRDLEAMRQLGVGGLLMFDARGYHDDQNHVIMPPSRMEFMSPEWRRRVRFSLSEANRLGLRVSLNLSSCAGALKGPWEVGKDAPKQLRWSSVSVQGPRHLSWELKKPSERPFWEVAIFAVRHSEPVLLADKSESWHEVVPRVGSLVAAAEVIDLSRKINAQGRLDWDAPPGPWTILRFVGVTMEGHEYDVDVMDRKAVAGHFERMGKTILEEAGPLAGRTLTHFYSVSWEGAVPTWTPDLEKEFRKYRGYALRSWLPVLAGFPVKSLEESERFLRDYYQTLGDVFRENFYGTMQALCHRHGLQWHSESGGPWNRKLASFAEADQPAFLGRNDMPQGEFWFTGTPVKRRQDMNRPPAMAAHIYGRRLAAAEAFTHMVHHWSAYPAVLKPFADAAFCDGINHLIWHTFTCSPPEFGKPGSEYFAGTHLNPNVTWFSMAGPFIEYLGRCQFMLRQGCFVSDVCAYMGDRSYQHWGRGTDWSERATMRLPPGYTYDLVNTEVLTSRLKVKKGNLVLPDGMSYRVLVVDLEEETAPLAALQKIAALKNAGATVVFGRRKPSRDSGRAAYPSGDLAVRELADRLWENSPTLNDALEGKCARPDFEGPFEFTHRRTPEADIYFVSGQGTAECAFRVSGRQPELWDAVSGRIMNATDWHVDHDGRPRVSLSLPENGSMFVVFRKPAFPRTTRSSASSRSMEVALTGPWTAYFEPGRGAPESTVFDPLIPWDLHSDERIRFFSGRATYRKDFDLTAGEARRAARLHLGEVRCIARVRLNGRDLGVVWTAPWSVDLTGAVQQGHNELEIDVVNTWVNRLIGDAGLPKDKRITKTNVALQRGARTLKPYQGFASDDPLMRSGLIGPVRLELLP
ncbi:MAG TPA: glycosyl hydrolase [Candidatus Paceibacterota bacterium]|nr:glycosyl hydrolase [Verrucomicrobiota bacterium]HRY49812.1 glycosyl hydrolase [Candidatus Paceibacterota bacterium]